RRRLEEGRCERAARVVDEDVDSAEALAGLGERPLESVAVADVDDESERVPARVAELALGGAGALGVALEDGDARPDGGERLRDAAADPGASSGDDRDPAVEAQCAFVDHRDRPWRARSAEVRAA